jgi:hypothetical protein
MVTVATTQKPSAAGLDDRLVVEGQRDREAGHCPYPGQHDIQLVGASEASSAGWSAPITHPLHSERQRHHRLAEGELHERDPHGAIVPWSGLADTLGAGRGDLG